MVVSVTVLGGLRIKRTAGINLETNLITHPMISINVKLPVFPGASCFYVILCGYFMSC